ncbi:MAG: class I SAM-dependent methyltransferase [Anaerolineae bacterium]|nr:class I SAM-dependent methyltransferase [Anaerolineae bacterium]
MSLAERQRWDQIFTSRAGGPFPAPDPLLLQYTPPARADGTQRSRALDIACGRGQNGLWLAEQGYSADLIDGSRVALTQAREEAGGRGLRTVNFLLMDLDAPILEAENAGLIAVFRFLNRSLFPVLRAALLPGGRIIYETFHTGYLQVNPTFNRAFLLEPGELAAQFEDWRVLRSVETEHSAQIVALKPTSG